MKKKVIMTGHTRGVGKWIYDSLCSEKYDVLGFSRTNGFDITCKSARSAIIESCVTADIFINNAHSDFAQLDLLTAVFNIWQNQPKLIINLGVSIFTPTLWNLVAAEYPAQKIALHALSQNLQSKKSACRITLLNLGVMDIAECQNIEGPKISQNAFLKYVYFLLDSPNDIQISTLCLDGHNSESQFETLG